MNFGTFFRALPVPDTQPEPRVTRAANAAGVASRDAFGLQAGLSAPLAQGSRTYPSVRTEKPFSELIEDASASPEGVQPHTTFQTVVEPVMAPDALTDTWVAQADSGTFALQDGSATAGGASASTGAVSGSGFGAAQWGLVGFAGAVSLAIASAGSHAGDSTSAGAMPAAAGTLPAVENVPHAPPSPAATSDIPKPPVLTFESSGYLLEVAENSDISKVIHTAHVVNAGQGTVTYSLAGQDAAAFHIDAASGVVTLLAPADYETKERYTFQVVATDSEGHTASQFAGLQVKDINEAPVAGVHRDIYYTPAENKVNLSIADLFTDPDTTSPNNALHYYLNGGSAPPWTQMADASFQVPAFLSFDAATGRFTGTMAKVQDGQDYSVTLVVGAVDTAAPVWIEHVSPRPAEGSYLELQLAGLSAQQTVTFHMSHTPVEATVVL